MTMKSSISRRGVLKSAAAVAALGVGAPMINIGRYQAFAASPKKYSARTMRVVERTPLFPDVAYFRTGVSVAEHDISSDGQRFLMLRRSIVTGDRSTPVVVLNWAEEVRRRMMEQGGRAP